MRSRLRASPVPPVWILFAGASLAGVALILVAFTSLRSYERSADTAFETTEILGAAAVLYTQLLDAQSSQQAYILTGEPAFLERYETTMATIPARVAVFEEYVESRGVNPEHVSALQLEVDALTNRLERGIELYAQDDTSAAIETVELWVQDPIIDRIRGTLGTLVVEEAAHHDAARATADRRASQATVALGALSLLTAGLIGVMFWAFRRRHVEEMLRRSNQTKDQMLGMVSHELRSPITVVIGNAKLLRNGDDRLPQDERDASIRDIEREAERLRHLVENMLSLSRIEGGGPAEMEPVDIEHIVRAAATRHQGQYPDREIHLQVKPGLPPAWGQPMYLEQVLENLLVNAEKYGPAEAPIDIVAGSAADRVTVSILDRGPGISDDERESIFEPFLQLPANGRRSGVGLGLAVCKRLMEAQGGDIIVELREGGGSVFSFSVPVATTSPADANDRPKATALRQPGID